MVFSNLPLALALQDIGCAAMRLTGSGFYLPPCIGTILDGS